MDDMTDRMDVDSDPSLDGTHLNDHDQGIGRARVTLAMDDEEDLIDISKPQEEGFVAVMHESLGGRSLKQTPANKQKVPLVQKVSTFFRRSLSPSGSQQGPHGMDVQDLRSQLEELQKANEDLEKGKRKARKKIDGLQETIDGLQETIDGLQEKIDGLQEKIDGSQENLESVLQTNQQLNRCKEDAEKTIESLRNQSNALSQELEAKKEEHRKETAQLKTQINDLTHTKDLLRQMIVPVSEKQVSDSEVVSRFSSLRSSILGLVRQTWKTALNDGVDPKRLSAYQQEFFRSHIPLSYDRLRFVVFQIIHAFILDPQGYFLGEGFEQLEQHIRTVEKDLNQNSSEEDRGRVLEWRNATFKATEKFRDNGRRLSSRAQESIWSFLRPLQTKDPATEQNGRKKVKAVCDKAMELSLMIRQLKDDFKVDNLDRAMGKPMSQWDTVAEDVVSVPARRDVQSGTIAYVMTGALVKSPKENLENVLVLEKAEVAVYM